MPTLLNLCAGRCLAPLLWAVLVAWALAACGRYEGPAEGTLVYRVTETSNLGAQPDEEPAFERVKFRLAPNALRITYLPPKPAEGAQPDSSQVLDILVRKRDTQPEFFILNHEDRFAMRIDSRTLGYRNVSGRLLETAGDRTASKLDQTKRVMGYRCEGFRVAISGPQLEFSQTFWLTAKLTDPSRMMMQYGPMQIFTNDKPRGFPLAMALNISLKGQGAVSPTRQTRLEALTANFEPVAPSVFDIPNRYELRDMRPNRAR